MRWIRAGWRPLAVIVGLVLLAVAIGYAAPMPRPGDDTVLHRLVARWAPEHLGSDECSVVDADLVGRLVDQEVRLTDRMLRPDGDGWRVRCGYGNGRLGLAPTTVTLRTGLDPDDWEPYRRTSEPAPVRLEVSTVGDETYLAFGQGPGDSTAVRVEARRGTSAVRLEYFAPTSMPNPLSGMRLVSAALDGMSESSYAPGALPVKSYAGCEQVDREAASGVLGEELRGVRTIHDRRYGAENDLYCGYAGESADLRVSVWRGMDAEAYLEPLRPDIEGLGDAAAFDATVFPDGQARFQATIQVGDRIVSVDAGFADREELDRRKPTEAERELLRSIVRALA